MLWLLVYLVIGLFYTTMSMHPVIRKVAQKNIDDAVWLIATIVISIAVIFLLTPFWFGLLGFDIAKFFYK